MKLEAYGKSLCNMDPKGYGKPLAPILQGGSEIKFSLEPINSSFPSSHLLQSFLMTLHFNCS